MVLWWGDEKQEYWANQKERFSRGPRIRDSKPTKSEDPSAAK